MKVGKSMGTVAYAVDKRHRMVVKRNLRFIFPLHPDGEITRLTLRIFQNTGITFLEILQLIYTPPEALRKKVIIDDPENYLEIYRHHKKVILVSAHMGNWEVPPLFWSMLFKPLLLVARPLDSPLLNRMMTGFRTRHGSMIIDKKGALQKLARGLRDNQPIGMLMDHDVRPAEAIKVNFLGKAVNSTPSVAWLAGRYDCPVVPVFCTREPDGKLRMRVNPPLNLARTDNPKNDLLTNSQIINDAISKAVLENVDQWFWFHKRWKRYYPDLYPEENRRIKKLNLKKAAKQ